MLSTFDMCIITKAYLQGNSLPLAAKALEWGVLLHGWAGSTRGPWKVTCFAVFLKLHGVGDKGKHRSSMCDVYGRFGTLNSKIPSLLDVA